jgi:hypothetical protein
MYWAYGVLGGGAERGLEIEARLVEPTRASQHGREIDPGVDVRGVERSDSRYWSAASSSRPASASATPRLFRTSARAGAVLRRPPGIA